MDIAELRRLRQFEEEKRKLKQLVADLTLDKHVLQREGWQVNHKQVYRLYQLEELSLRLKSRRKRPSRLRMIMPRAHAPDEHWSLDFIADSLADGRRFRAFTLVDNMNRESPVIEVNRPLSGQQVAAVLEPLASTHGLPKPLCVDNGLKCTSTALEAWAHRHGVLLALSRPGTPTDHPCIEALVLVREECLHQLGLVSMEEDGRPWKLGG
jgi:putative transposase